MFVRFVITVSMVEAEVAITRVGVFGDHSNPKVASMSPNVYVNEFVRFETPMLKSPIIMKFSLLLLNSMRSFSN